MSGNKRRPEFIFKGAITYQEKLTEFSKSRHILIK